MSRENEINELVKDFPLHVKWNYLDDRFGYVKIRHFLSYEDIEIDKETVLLVEIGTQFLYGVLTEDKVYLVEYAHGYYAVVDKVDSVKWMDETVAKHKRERRIRREEQEMKKEKEINELVKDFPLENCRGFLLKKYGTFEMSKLFSYETIKLKNGAVFILESDTNFFDILYGVLTKGMLYEVDVVDGEYVVVNQIYPRKWFEDKLEYWDEYLNGGM